MLKINCNILGKVQIKYELIVYYIILYIYIYIYGLA